jgi:hypothetical protein
VSVHSQSVGRAALVALALSTLAAPAVAAPDPDPGPGPGPSPSATPSTAAASTCFPTTGTPIVVGREGPRIDLTIHRSLLGTPTDPGALGLEAVGSTTEYRVVALRAGVVFEGVDDPVAFLLDPFARFRVVFAYTLSLPMLAPAPGETTYEQDDPFVRGPVESADCPPPNGTTPPP